MCTVDGKEVLYPITRDNKPVTVDKRVVISCKKKVLIPHNKFSDLSEQELYISCVATARPNALFCLSPFFIFRALTSCVE